MIRCMNSVVRTAKQNIHQKPFHTSNVKLTSFEKRLERLHEAQLRTQMDSNPTYLKDDKLFFSFTCFLGAISAGLAFKTLYKFIKSY